MSFFRKRSSRPSTTARPAAPAATATATAEAASASTLAPTSTRPLPLSGPRCKCGQPSVERTVKKEGPNKGKHFVVCAQPQGIQCNYFEWADTLPGPSRPSLASAFQGRKRMAEHEGEATANGKRARGGEGVRLTLVLEEIDCLAGRVHEGMGVGVVEAVRAAVGEVEGCKEGKTGLLSVRKVQVPVARVGEFERVMRERGGVEVEFGTPRRVLERIGEYWEGERRRERGGDVVKGALDEVLPKKVCDRMMDFQWDGVYFALKRGGRCLIGDDMGLGKTLQAIAVARVYMADWPLLIVCPSSLRLNWKEEMLQWLEGDVEEEDVLVMMMGKDIDRPIRRVNIVSYDLMRKMPPAFVRRCGFVIADESHYLKSGQAKRSQAVLPLIKNARRALLLSGTPALSRPVELFAQINAIAPVLFPNYREFVERYCAAHVGRFGFDVSGASNLDELHVLLRGSVLIRRKKEEVLTQLPEKQRQVFWVQTRPKVMKDVEKAFKEFERAKEKVNGAQSDAQAAVLQNSVKKAQNELYSLTGAAKLDAVKEFCKDTAEIGGKFIVFVHHKEVMEELDDYLRMKLKLGIIRIDGTTPQSNRQMLCKRFQEHAQSRVALLSITAAGVGLTLTQAKVVLFAELYWNPGSLLQAEDRAHRIGQRDCVLVKYLLAKKTLDESMWSTVRRKLTVVGHSLTGTAAKMDVADSKQPVRGVKRASTQFFKTRTQTQGTATTQTGSGTQDTDVVEVVDLDGSPSRNTEPTQNVTEHQEESLEKDSMFPLSLSELDTEQRDVSLVQEVPSNVHLTERRAQQKQMDADIALAQKLQAQFDRENAG